MTTHASGPFDVKLTQQASEDTTGGAAIGRLAIDKRYHGDLDATSNGQMLAHRTPVDGSAGYVAMEIVTGSLHGRNGTFLLQHSGTMDRGEAKLTLTVLPDSGTDQLTGLTGAMGIVIADGKHFYAFDYALPDPV